MAAGKKPHWRFKLDAGDVTWDDVIQGPKAFPAAALSDPVLVREDGVPLYTFSSVVDDVEFDISHVIRGEDHVTNTAVQIQIWRALGEKPPPVFAHFPLIVSASGVEMSKRLGTLSIASLREDAALEPMSINSLLARLGTSEPIMPRLALTELVADFDLGRISHSTPKFDQAELEALNAKILHITPFAHVCERLKALGLDGADEHFWNAVRSNLVKFGDIKLWWQVAKGPITPTITEPDFARAAAEALPQEPWDQNTWTAWTEAVKSKTGRKGKELFMPLRLALTGTDHGPEMKVLLPMIGPARTRARLEGKAA
jgi:glutamyl-tRNA synthetase